jgi:hypothetical protein
MRPFFLLPIGFLMFCNTVSIAQENSQRPKIIITGAIGGGVGLGFQKNSPATTASNTIVVGNAPSLTLNRSLHLNAEYLLHTKWSIGVSLAQNSYHVSSSQTSKGINGSVFGTLYFVNKEKSNVYTRLHLGVSSMKMTETSSLLRYNYQEAIFKYTMNGAYIKPSVGYQYYFGNKLGFFADAGIAVSILKGTTYEANDGKGQQNINPSTSLIITNIEMSGGLVFRL